MNRDVPVVADAGPVIHLAEADAMDALRRFDRVLVPRTVLEELRAGGFPDGFDSLDYERTEANVGDDRWQSLDPGETAALAVSERIGGILLTDDLDARERAAENGIEVHGSIGVVLAAYAEGRLDAGAARARIRALERDSTLYLSDPLVTRAIERIEKRERNDE